MLQLIPRWKKIEIYISTVQTSFSIAETYENY